MWGMQLAVLARAQRSATISNPNGRNIVVGSSQRLSARNMYCRYGVPAPVTTGRRSLKRRIGAASLKGLQGETGHLRDGVIQNQNSFTRACFAFLSSKRARPILPSLLRSNSRKYSGVIIRIAITFKSVDTINSCRGP
jgi:hypothetical protein